MSLVQTLDVSACIPEAAESALHAHIQAVIITVIIGTPGAEHDLPALNWPHNTDKGDNGLLIARARGRTLCVILS